MNQQTQKYMPIRGPDGRYAHQQEGAGEAAQVRAGEGDDPAALKRVVEALNALGAEGGIPHGIVSRIEAACDCHSKGTPEERVAAAIGSVEVTEELAEQILDLLPDPDEGEEEEQDEEEEAENRLQNVEGTEYLAPSPPAAG